jgi:hypothetical protein
MHEFEDLLAFWCKIAHWILQKKVVVTRTRYKIHARSDKQEVTNV